MFPPYLVAQPLPTSSMPSTSTKPSLILRSIRVAQRRCPNQTAQSIVDALGSGLIVMPTSLLTKFSRVGAGHIGAGGLLERHMRIEDAYGRLKRQDG